jgi:hypothetical protein
VRNVKGRAQAVTGTTPMANPEDSDLDESHAQTHDVFLRRYTLSYSASCPPFFRSWVFLYENIVPTSWLSHYTLIVGDYYFDLERQGSLPFARRKARHDGSIPEHYQNKAYAIYTQPLIRNEVTIF